MCVVCCLRYFLFVVYCLLVVDCCSLFGVVGCVLRVDCCLSFLVCGCLPFVACCLLFSVRCVMLSSECGLLFVVVGGRCASSVVAGCCSLLAVCC